MSNLELTGLHAHHPLGFLAACGLLRCLADWKDFGETRLRWQRDEDRRTFAVIEGERLLDIDGVAQVLLCRSKEQRESPALTWSTKIDDRAKYRKTARKAVEQFCDGASRDALDILAALASDLVLEKKGKLRSTGFDLTSGNQQLLKSFRVLAGEPETVKAKPSPLSQVAIRGALLGPWTYQDDHHSLGWDPQAQRLHALRGKLPEKDKANRSVRAAVFLASQALPLFPCFAVGGSLRTTGFHHCDGDDWFAWPIWNHPISLDTLRSLLAHPFGADLKGRGVEVVYRCRCAHTGGSEGNYQVFSHPEERPWPAFSVGGVLHGRSNHDADRRSGPDTARGTPAKELG